MAGGASRARACEHPGGDGVPRAGARPGRGADDERVEAPDVQHDELDAAGGAHARAEAAVFTRAGARARAPARAAGDLLVPVQGGGQHVWQGPDVAEREGGGHEGRRVHLLADWGAVHLARGVRDAVVVTRLHAIDQPG